VVVQTLKKDGYRVEIQGLRAVAVLLVVFYHSEVIFKSGFIGVDVFFVISGFVIAQSLNHQYSEQNSFSVASFYARRIRRLLPGLTAMLTVVLVLSTWLSTISSRVQTVRTGLFATFSLSNLFLFRFRPDGYFEVTEKTNALIHTWSLSIEEQFYLIFPIIFALVVLCGKSRRIGQQKLLVVVFAVIASLSLAFSVYISTRGIHGLTGVVFRIVGSDSLDSRFAFYLPFTRAWEFLAGVLLAQICAHRKSSTKTELFGLIGLILIVFSALSFESVSSFPGYVVIVPVLGTTLVLFFSTEKSLLGKILSHKWLVWIGDRSYGWYLWHWPLIQFVKPFWPNSHAASLFAGLSAIVPAAISYQYLENRFRHQLRWRKPGMMMVLISFSLLLPLVAAAASRSVMPELGPHQDATLGCEYGDLMKIEPGGKCVFPSGLDGGSAVLIGDSHAGQLTEAFIPASHEMGLDAVIAVKGNNPFLFTTWDEALNETGYPFLALQRIIEINPEVVVIAQSSYVREAPSAITWSDQFYPILEILDKHNISVVVVSESVVVNIRPQECSVFQVLLGFCNAEKSLNKEDLEKGRSVRVKQEEIAVSKVSNAVILDTLPVLCPNQKCLTRRDGEWWWRDDAHISITASKALTPLITNAMRNAIKLTS
jgi:peptidoglycan/LPS O-acetylase OafA/YrhL